MQHHNIISHKTVKMCEELHFANAVKSFDKPLNCRDKDTFSRLFFPQV